MASESAPHMTSEEFRRHGHAVVDWVADYLDRVADLPVLAQVKPGEIRARLPAGPPEIGEPFEAVLRDLDDVVVPGLTHWQSPDFFAYFPANVSGPSILGELVSAGLGVQGMLWSTSPAMTEIETHVLDWVVDLLGLPAGFSSAGAGGGVLQDSASSAVLCALLAARERATGGAATHAGVDRALTVYTSSQAHSSVEKAVRIAGLGSDRLRLVDVDAAFALRPDDLARRMADDRAAGATPCLVVATVGTTSSTAIDPVRAAGEICRREGAWLHVDAAYAGSAAVCPELRWIHDGLELADSYAFNPHKWLLTNFDCCCFYVTDRAALVRALSILPEYLRNTATESGSVIDYRDWQVPLGRRFRALKLWFVIRHYGAEGLRRHIRSHVAAARELAAAVAADPGFELAAPALLGLVCLRHRGGDDVNQAVLDRVNASGRLHLTHTRLDGKLTLRVAVGGARTERRHVLRAWEQIRDTARTLAGGG
ncbi:pyridoxal-dependent decarboxylase [soil metagenome]